MPDGKFGAENTTTNEWNGLVREIIDKVIKFNFQNFVDVFFYQEVTLLV